MLARLRRSLVSLRTGGGLTHGGERLSSFLVHGGTLVCMDAARTVARGDLLVVDGRIAALGDGVPARLLEGAERALDRALELARRFHGAAGGRLTVSLAPRFILSCSEQLWRDVTEASREHGLLVHTHLAESPAEGGEVKAAVGSHAAPYFAAHDVLSPRFVGAHGVWLDDNELELVRRADAALVHCPGSNLKL